MNIVPCHCFVHLIPTADAAAAIRNLLTNIFAPAETVVCAHANSSVVLDFCPESAGDSDGVSEVLRFIGQGGFADAKCVKNCRCHFGSRRFPDRVTDEWVIACGE